MRHGEAVMQIQHDFNRPLTPNGAQESVVMSNWLIAQNITLDTIISSPYTRAQETAELVSKQLQLNNAIQTLDLITPEGSATKVHDYLDAVINIHGYENILLVSHMPLVSYLLAEVSVDKVSPIFATAAIAHIHYNIDTMSGQLVSLLAPDDIG